MSTYKTSLGSQPAADNTYHGDSGGGAPVYRGAPQVSGSPAPATDPFNGPGSIDFNLTDPAASAEQAASTSQDMFTGLKAFLFGTDRPDAKGNHGGVPVLSAPVVGDALRLGSEVVANVAGGGIGHAVDAVGGALERVGVPGAGNVGVVGNDLHATFDAIPDDSPAKQAALKQMEADKGLFDTGLLSGKDHYMSLAVQKYQDEALQQNPDLWSGLFRPSASLADTVSNLFGILGASQRGAERAIAGAGRPGSGDQNQLAMIMAVGDGQAVWTADDPGLTPVEQMVYDQRRSGAWTDGQALDFMASHGAGLAHSKALELAGSVAADPLTIATLGAGAIAKIGETGFMLSKTLNAAKAGLKLAEEAGDAAKIEQYTKAVEVASQGIKSGTAAEGVADRNLLGQLAKQQWTGNAARRYGAMYGSLEGTGFGKAAKIARTIIDPMHAMDFHPRAEAAIEEGSRQVTQAVVMAHGELGHIDVIRGLRELPGAGHIADLYNEGLAIYSGNVFRRVAGRSYRAVQMAMTDKGEKLIETLPFESLKAAMSGMRKRSLVQLEEEAGQWVRGGNWSVAEDADLAKRMATHLGGLDQEGWVKHIEGLSGSQKSLLHASTYGIAVKQLHSVKSALRMGGELDEFSQRFLRRGVLLNRNTLTQIGHEGIMARLDEATELDDKMAVIERARETYPQLRSFNMDRTSYSETIKDFEDMMDRMYDRLPSQIRDSERANLPEALRDFDKMITPSADPLDSTFTIGFRPDDEMLWALERDSDGVLREVADPWFDQVSTEDSILRTYSPVREPEFNIAGQAIPGMYKAAAALDHAEALGRMAFHGVTGRMISTAAHNKFVEGILPKYVDKDGNLLLTRSQVEGIWSALMKKVEDSRDLSGMRGLSKEGMWDAAKSVIPKYAESAGLDRRALLLHVLDAYDGDIRQIGLTQKLTGRVKLGLGHTALGNTAGVISEHAWPLLKFRLNPFFQLQEKIEPWVLNAQRGISSALGTHTTELDRKAMDVYATFADKNLINVFDNDLSELGARFAIGHGLQASARAEGGKLTAWTQGLEGMFDVQGTKQLAMMRTWRRGLGANMRKEWELHSPGEFDRMLDHQRALMGEVISEDDFAALTAHSNLAANGVFSKTVDGVTHLDFHASIQEGMWTAPQHLGEMRPLDLNYMTRRLALSDNQGRELLTSMDMRRALADDRISMRTIQRALRDQGAHPDYRGRVERAFAFSHNDFWQGVQDTFSLTRAERARFESMFSRVATQRGMTPAEYLSQVYNPHIGRGTDAVIGSLQGLVDFSRSGGALENLDDLSQLRGIAGQSNIQDLYRQFGQVFSAHLDPSAKRAFLETIMGEGNAPEDINGILDTWEQLGASDQMMARVTNFMQGTPGTRGTLVADEATGVARIRNGAMEYRARQGRPRNMQRTTAADDPALAREMAAEYDALPEFQHVATEGELADRVRISAVDEAKSRTAVRASDIRGDGVHLPTKAREQYDSRMVETRKLYSHLTAKVSDGGLGIKVKSVASDAPYADADALRADLERGVLKVPRSGHWHPYMTTPDLFMERAVTDAFGHGQEAVALGSHDAHMSAAAMYSDGTRGSYILDNFAPRAWEQHSDRVIEQAVAEPQTIAEYENRYGRTAPDRVRQESGVPGLNSPFYSRSVGQGVRALPEAQQRELIGDLGVIRNQFPNVPFGRIDVGDLRGVGAVAATLSYPQAIPTIVMSEHAGWQAEEAVREGTRMFRQDRADSLLREEGVHREASATVRGDLYHEWMHAVDHHLHAEGARVNGALERSVYADDELTDLMSAYREDGVAAKVSHYANTENSHTVMTDSEGFAELGDLAFNPDHSAFVLGEEPNAAGEFIDPEVQAYVNDFRRILRKNGTWVPDGVGVPANPHAGMTVSAANAAGAGIRAPHRLGALSQDLTDRLTEGFIGTGRYAESNPDIARVSGYMRDFMASATGDLFEHDTAAQYAHLFDSMSGLEVKDAEPFNVTEAALWHGQAQMMAAKWEDAFRLQYFAQNRSMLQRSINHPMFGLYPASYMWGKIGPELVKFMAHEPFGARTGAMGYTLLDLQKAVAVQRQYDPKFDKAIEDLGHSAALSWLGYMLPATPWSVPSSYPAWMRDMSEQGLANNAKANAGGTIEDNNFISPLNASIKKVFPMSTQLPFFGRALDDAGKALPWNQNQTVQAPPPVQSLALPGAQAPSLSETGQGAPQPPEVGQVTGPTTALGTQDVLAAQMADLQALLSTG